MSRNLAESTNNKLLVQFQKLEPSKYPISYMSTRYVSRM